MLLIINCSTHAIRNDHCWSARRSSQCAIEGLPGNHLIACTQKDTYIRPNRQQRMSMEEVKRFLLTIRDNKPLYDKVASVATASEIASIASTMGFEFTATELKSIPNQTVEGVRIKSQDTTPSYNFGEGGK